MSLKFLKLSRQSGEFESYRPRHFFPVTYGIYSFARLHSGYPISSKKQGDSRCMQPISPDSGYTAFNRKQPATSCSMGSNAPTKLIVDSYPPRKRKQSAGNNSGHRH